MKKFLALVLALCLLPAAGLADAVVTSFYPIYLFALNLTEGIDDLTVRNLAAPDTGCLHDYQLQTSDMKVLAKADAFLINGAGMESYLENVFEIFPDLPVTDASAGIALICEEEGHDHEHEDHDHEHSLYNAHVWLDAENAITMVHNLADGLIAAFPAHAQTIAFNRDAYTERLAVLDAELVEQLSVLTRKDIITFHEAFPYFAEGYGLHVAAVVNREPSDSLSPAALASLVKTVVELGVPPLFVEPQYSDIAAQTIARETGASIYTLDPIVTGPSEDVPLTYYEDTMRANAQVLLEALNK